MAFVFVLHLASRVEKEKKKKRKDHDNRNVRKEYLRRISEQINKYVLIEIQVANVIFFVMFYPELCWVSFDQ